MRCDQLGEALKLTVIVELRDPAHQDHRAIRQLTTAGPDKKGSLRDDAELLELPTEGRIESGRKRVVIHAIRAGVVIGNQIPNRAGITPVECFVCRQKCAALRDMPAGRPLDRAQPRV